MRVLSVGGVAAVCVLQFSAMDVLALEVRAGEQGDQGPIRADELALDVHVEGEVASAVMEFSLITDGDGFRQVEMLLPMPPGAVIRGAEDWMPAQDRWEPAETTGRQEGTDVYNAITRPRPCEPLLIQQVGPDAYRTLGYPVTVEQPMHIRIHYAHFLEGSGGTRTLRIAVENDDVDPAMVPSVKIRVHLVPGAWQSGNWRFDGYGAARRTLDVATGLATLDLDYAALDHDITLELEPTQPLPRASGLLYRSPDARVEPHAVARWAPDLGPEQLEKREVVFILDVSGSMSGNKLAQSVDVIGRALDNLEDGERFSVVAFSDATAAAGAPQVGLGGCVDTSALPGAPLGRMYDAAERDEGKQFLNGLRALGGTNLGAGLDRAMDIAATENSGRPIDLVLVTDGNPNAGPQSSGDLINALEEAQARAGRPARLFALGIGADLNQRLISALTERFAGISTFALEDGAIPGQFLAMFQQVRRDGVGNARLAVDDAAGSTMDLGIPRILPGSVLTLGIRSAAGETLELRLNGTDRDGHAVEHVDSARLLAGGASGAHLAVPALMAKSWADELEREVDVLGETPARLEAAVVLARTYGIVTRYSALLALEFPGMYAQYNIARPARDPAGVAVEPVQGTRTDEGRMGGDGSMASLGPTTGGSGGSGASGCECSPPRQPPWVGLALVLGVWAALALGRRARRTACGPM
ncbi:MAG: VWA domain-containing protein [Deltaproteobacteria bacterium]|nr:VWA domain-containing protein [Deltaproteobacteria bacterium]